MSDAPAFAACTSARTVRCSLTRLSAVALASALLALPRASHAAPRQGARLVWVRGADAAGCVGRKALEEDVKARLGWNPFVAPSDLEIEGFVRDLASPHRGFSAELVMRDASGTLLGRRTLASSQPDCRSLGEAVAVAITVAIDPDAAGTPLPAAPETPGSGEPEPARAPALPLVGSVGWRAHPMLSAGASVGLLPDVSAFATLRFGFVRDRWEIGVAVSVWPESRTGGLGFGLATTSVDACLSPSTTSSVLRWCAALHLGLFDVFVHAPELAPLEVGMSPWAGAETGPAVSLPLVGALRLEGGVSAMVPITRKEVFLRGNAAPEWAQGVLGGRAQIGVGALF